MRSHIDDWIAADPEIQTTDVEVIAFMNNGLKIKMTK